MQKYFMKKKRKTLSFMALLLSFSIYFSCVDEGVEVSRLQTSNQNSDLLAYAKKLVGENGERCSLIDLQKGSTNSRVATDYSTVATPLWEKAKTERHGGEEVLTVPLQSEQDIHSSMYFEEEHKDRVYKTKTFSRLVIRKKNGVTFSQIFTYLPSRNYAKNRQEVLDTMGFSPLAVKYYGTILISGLDGKFQQGFFYERGVPTIHFTSKKHTHVSCSINDTTLCDSIDHSPSINVRLNLSGKPAIASRSYAQGDETDLICMFCGGSALTCSCLPVDGNYVYCDGCKMLKGQCICDQLCLVCGQLYCICDMCMECYSIPCICGLPEDKPVNGGGGNSNPTPPNTPQPDTLSVDSLEWLIKDILYNNCGLAEALDDIDGLSRVQGIKFDSKEHAGYDPRDKKFVFNPNWDGDVNGKVFLEELFHCLQDNNYSNGTEQYLKLGLTNLEFEAKIAVDIYVAGNNKHGYKNKIVMGESTPLFRIPNDSIDFDDYNLLLKNIRKEDEFPIEHYNKWLHIFGKFYPYVKEENIIDSLEPQILKKYGKKFFKNNCK